ncbi:MAG: glutamate mutase L, partial [Candidatus Sabulitectum sp.]|nr:glutamate mutase L [Candidatus Sabulitectum sp.]
IAAVQDLFMDHVMKRAPGYPKLLKLVSAPIVPTPVGVANILKAGSSALGIGAMLVDMGGATTDIFTVSKGNMERTVAANIGMSFSMTNTLAEAGLPAILRHIPGVSSESLRSWVMSKSLFPSTVPDSSIESDIEASVAVEGLRVAWSHHLVVAYNTGLLAWRERLSPRRPSAMNPVLETLSGKRFKLDKLGMLIGAGGIFSHSSPLRSAWLLAEAFRPPGLTTLYVDSDFRSPHMGTLMQKYPEEALEFYMRNCIRPVCRVLSPAFVTNGKFAEVTGSFGKKTVRSGEFLFIPDTSGMSVKVFDHSIVGVESVCDGLPLLIDCRKNSEPLPLDFLEEPQCSDQQITLPARAIPRLTRQQIEYSMSLPCEGVLYAARGSKVSAGECLGQVKEVPPRHFVIDIRGLLCCPSELSDAEVRKAIAVSRGTTVNTGDLLFDHLIGQYRAMYCSPVNGIVTRIISPGIVMLEEDMTHDHKPHVIQVSHKMGVHPHKMKKYLRVAVGDFVYRSHLLACDPRVSSCLAPHPGFVTNIDHKLGTITIQYTMTPIRIESPLAATVVSTASCRAVSLVSSGLKLSGVLGFGRTVRGTLHPLADSSTNDIAFVSNSADSAILSLAARKGVAGLICPSIAADTLVGWLGREPGIFITGQEKTPFSLMILGGIGSAGVDAHVLDSLSMAWGNHSALFPETKIRAGIHRPFLAISSG